MQSRPGCYILVALRLFGRWLPRAVRVRRPPRPPRPRRPRPRAAARPTRNGRCRTRTRRPPATATSAQITADNVKDLKVAWTFSTGVLRGHEGEPIVVGNTMYLATPFPNIVYALDLTKEGAPIKWKYAPKQDPAVIPIACCDTVNRGVTYSNGKIFMNQLDTNTVALDAATGKELWKVKQGDYKQGQTITSAPMVIKDKVISGISRRRVRRARLRHRQRRQHRQAGVAHVQHRPRGRSRLPRLGRDLEGRRVEARRRHDVGLVQLRPRARTSSTTAPATPARGTPISVPATTSTR